MNAREKEINRILKLLKSGYSLITLSNDEATLLTDYIEELNCCLGVADEANETLTKRIMELNKEKSIQNARLIASWQQSRTGSIYRKYYLIFNGATYPLDVYSSNDNYMNLNATPTYLNADLQFFLHGKSGLSELIEIDYTTFKKCHSGI